ncbi:MAG: hypothetical protein ACJ8F7_03265 [Gemmataceae bacterium]
MAELVPSTQQTARPATAAVPQQVPVPPGVPGSKDEEVVVVSHSGLLYWWPVWLVGYVMAVITWLDGTSVQIGESVVRFHPSGDVGVVFFITLFLIIVIASVTFRGMVSVVMILSAVMIALIMVYFGVWGRVLGWLGDLKIYLNQGAYFWFSTLLFLVWAFTVFGFDQFARWRIRPGQATEEYILGAGSRSFSTGKMTLEKRHTDVFRHWLIGLGSGDIIIRTSGATREEIQIRNVLFVRPKLRAIERVIKEQPSPNDVAIVNG